MTVSSPYCRRVLTLLLTSFVFLWTPVLSAADSPGQFAVLIGVDGYEHAPALSTAVSVTVRLASTLQRYGGYRSADVLQLLDAAADPALHPTRANLLAELPRWLSKAGENDRVLIAFAGHAYRADDGELYLAAQDTDPDDLAGTGVAVSWLKDQLAACLAQTKLLLLDTLRSDAKGSASVTGITAAEAAEPLRNVPGLTVLAASSAGQASLVCTDRQQSLLMFWTVEGLKGHGDADSDGLITVDELAAYVQRQVAAEAQQRFDADQRPQRLGLPADDDQPAAVCRVRPQTLKRTLADLADQLAVQLEIHQQPRVGVLEFTTETGAGEVLGAEFGILGRYCGGELQQQLLTRSTGRFDVADRRRLDQALKEAEFKITDLGSEAALKELGQRAGQLPVVAVGTLIARDGRTVTLRCQLLRTDDSGLVVQTTVRADLNDSEWAMLGRSVNIEPTDYAPPADPVAPVPTQVAQISQIEQRAETTHPLADSQFPLRVRIMVGNQERKGVFRDGEMRVPLNTGEVYRIQVENGQDHGVFMRLLVDGLNTLPERVWSKGVEVEAAPKRELAVAQPVNLAEARAWWLDPPAAGQTARVYSVNGFFSQVGENAKFNDFRVVDAQDSQAARIGFADQAGLITAAFYQPVPKPVDDGKRALGTALGDEYQTQTEMYKGNEIPGPLLAVIHIRYVKAGTEH
jgi:hypothetical protein